MPIQCTEVFTPNDFPTFTYIRRTGRDMEELLRNAMATPKVVVSVSGPSKSGKTVLVEKVVGKDNLIQVSGATIKSADDIWEQVLDWMDAPATVTKQTSFSTSNQSTTSLSAKGKLPFVAEAAGAAAAQTGSSEGESRSQTRNRGGIIQVRDEIAGSDFVVFLDDFHYIERDVQVDAAKQIKYAAEQGVRVCVASVPHRADDVVRSNPELRGRTANIDIDFWNPSELEQIALIGFHRLNVDIEREDARKFAIEASGSPQLMQSICLQTCFHEHIMQEQNTKRPLQLAPEHLAHILQQTATMTDYSSLVRDMHGGPKTRGTERREFEFIDGSRGDVYRCALLALAADPPKINFSWSDLSNRIGAVCGGGVQPSGSSYREAFRQFSNFAVRSSASNRIIEWDEEGESQVVTIVDPYFLFYLRASDKLQTLSKSQSNSMS